MIILGDAGINYYGGWRDVHKKQRLAKLPITLFSIHGNHEMRPGTLPCYHTVEWKGGQIYVEDAYPNLLFAVDGEVYNLSGIETLVIGGAYSIDKFYRLAFGYGWWPDEQPSPAIKEKVKRDPEKGHFRRNEHGLLPLEYFESIAMIICQYLCSILYMFPFNGLALFIYTALSSAANEYSDASQAA